MAAHRYWRILVTATYGTQGYVSAQHIEFRGVAGGPSLPQTLGGSVLQSSNFPGPYGAHRAFNNDPNDYWASDGNPPQFIGWDFQGNSPDIVQITIQARLSEGGDGLDAFKSWVFQYSDDGATWTNAGLSGTNEPAWAAGETRAYSMAPPETLVNVTQAQAFSVTRVAAKFENVFQAAPLVVYNIPAEEMHASAAREDIVYRRVAQGMDISQASAMVVYRGRIERPEVRAWTFTLDNHDFYVLRLGSIATLVYDVYSEQWVEWGDGAGPLWWVNTGMTWLGGQSLAHEYGSSIVVGDDTIGRLWLLDPEQPFDDAADPMSLTQERPFRRIVMGQAVARGREVIPCYAIFLTGDNYGIDASEIVASVKLETSDDAGKTFEDHGFITVDAQTLDQSYEWLSLGQIEAPGRLFRITDNGVFARIDSMDMNDGE